MGLPDEVELYGMVMKYCARRGCMKLLKNIPGRLRRITEWSLAYAARYAHKAFLSRSYTLNVAVNCAKWLRASSLLS